MKNATIQYIENVVQRKEAARSIETKTIIAVHEYCAMGQRPGQALMNALRVVAPELYTILSGTLQFDCFYNDDKISATLGELGFNESVFRRVMTSHVR